MFRLLVYTCLPTIRFIPLSSIVTVGGIAWKNPLTWPSLSWKGYRECTSWSHEGQKNFFGQSWHCMRTFPSKHIWQRLGEGSPSQLRTASSRSFRMLSQFVDKFTMRVSQLWDEASNELRSSSHLAKAASRLSVEQVLIFLFIKPGTYVIPEFRLVYRPWYMNSYTMDHKYRVFHNVVLNFQILFWGFNKSTTPLAFV